MGEAIAGPFGSVSVSDGYQQYLQPVIFEPWAQRLVAFVGLQPGQTVLDVAAGTGALSRAAAFAVGPSGRVIASDISAQMLTHVPAGARAGGAPIEVLECSATELALPDGSVDVVLCQQGFPFIPDRSAAAREMHRVLRPGGKVGVAVWLSGRRLEPFDTYADTLKASGIESPFPNAYDSSKLSMSTDEVHRALTDGGFVDVEVAAEDLTLRWASPDQAALAITGTPYGPAITALEDDGQKRLADALMAALTASDGTPVAHVTTSLLGRGIVA